MTDSLAFSFHAAEDDTPYWQQGDVDLDSPEAQAMREALRHDARVLHALDRYWAVYDKDADSRISKEEYLKVHAKFALVLIPDITLEEALSSGEEDWAEDAKGQPSMSQDDLYDCLFQLADMWCTGIDGDEYAGFLRKLFRRITVRYSTDASGHVHSVPPKPPSDKKKSEW